MSINAEAQTDAATQIGSDHVQVYIPPTQQEALPSSNDNLKMPTGRGCADGKSALTDGHENGHENEIRNKNDIVEKKELSVYRSFEYQTDIPPKSSSTGRWKTFVLAYQTMGVVFAGIGTCPLYVFSSFELVSPTEHDYLGIMSIVFWTFTLISLVKYGLIVLHADDQGEGGTFVLYSLLCQHAEISRDGRASKKIQCPERKRSARQCKVITFLERRKSIQMLLFIGTLMGACMLIGDGILTPAISVLSAVQGLKTASSSLNQTTIVAITAALLIALFLLQRYGTSRVSFLFSPIVVAWFISTPLVGAYNIALHYPGVFKAISPHYLITFFLRRGKAGWKVLAGTVLCVTSSEAMYADLGHFNRISMQVAFIFVAYPSNLITYAGQAAYLIKHPANDGQVFYNFIPRPVFWPMFIIATLAAIVASQCLISACFSLVKQSVALDMFPNVRLTHTSDNHEGQIYSPEVNGFLMVLCVFVVLGFRDSRSLGNAYGVAVIFVMLITTVFVSLVMLVVWDTAPPVVLVFLFTYVAIEGIYVSAVLSKVPEGGWLPFVVAILLAVIMYSWAYGRRKHHAYEKAMSKSVDDFGAYLAASNTQRVSGIAMFYCDLEEDVPPLMTHYVKNVRSLQNMIIFTTLRYVKVPKIDEAARFQIYKYTGQKGLYRCVALYGYAEEREVDWGGLWESLAVKLQCYIESLNVESDNEAEISSPSQASDIAVESCTMDTVIARREEPVLVIGRTRLVRQRSTGTRNLVGKLVLDFIYQFLYSASTFSASALTRTVPPSNLMEISMLYEV